MVKVVVDESAKLEEELIVRPTSKQLFGIHIEIGCNPMSLPILINQWANVVRWEMRTRCF